MFRFLYGGMTSAAEGQQSPVVLWFNRAAVFVVLAAPFAGAVFAIVHGVTDPPSARDLVLFGALVPVTGMGVTMGFHRLLAHRSYRTSRPLEFLLLVFGTWAIQGAPVTWAAIHGRHHARSDTKDDPHSPIPSFIHGHMGWLFGTLRADPSVYAPWALRDGVAMFVSRTAFWWAVLGLVLPGLVGGWSGFLWGGLVRVFVVHHATYSVNSIGHRFGSRPFRTTGADRSTNHWLVGLWAFGEGWHNNHHAFPRSAYHGLRWWEVDLSGYVIWTLSKLGLVREPHRVPQRILEARRQRA